MVDLDVELVHTAAAAEFFVAWVASADSPPFLSQKTDLISHQMMSCYEQLLYSSCDRPLPNSFLLPLSPKKVD